jgi:hypothetical protein
LITQLVWHAKEGVTGDDCLDLHSILVRGIGDDDISVARTTFAVNIDKDLSGVDIENLLDDRLVSIERLGHFFHSWELVARQAVVSVVQHDNAKDRAR